MKVDLLTKKTLVTYLWAAVRGTSLFAVCERSIAWARRFLFFTRILRWLSIAAAIIESSVIFIVLTFVILTLLPVFILSATVILLADFFIGRRILKNGVLDDALTRDRIYVIARADRFGDGFAGELADSGAAVFVISADLRRHFLCARRYGGVWYIRHAFFFRLKRRHFAAMPQRMRYLL